MKTFRVQLVNGHTFEVEADFISRKMEDLEQGRGTIFFWDKPHWYSQRRCVGSVDWQVICYACRVKANKTGAEIAKELGVKL